MALASAKVFMGGRDLREGSSGSFMRGGKFGAPGGDGKAGLMDWLSGSGGVVELSHGSGS